MIVLRILAIFLAVGLLLGAVFLLAAVAAYWRGPYRREDDLTDTRPSRPVR